MLRIALMMIIVLTGALVLGGVDALAQDAPKDRKAQLKAAKDAAREKAREKVLRAKERNGEQGKSEEAGDDAKEEAKEEAKEGDKPSVDKEGRGKALTLDEENAKHARRLERIATIEAKAKKNNNKTGLLERVAKLRENEMRRHDKALARINDTKADGKPDDDKKDAKDEAKDAKKDAKEEAKDAKKDAKEEAKDAKKDAKDAAKDAKKNKKDGGK